MSAPAKFFKNNRGNLQLIDNNGYTMVRHSGCDAPGKRVYFRCSEYKKGCKTWAIVQDNKIVNTPILHNHFRGNIDSKLVELCVLAKSEDLKIRPKQILNELDKLPPSVRDGLAPKKSLLRRMKERRMKVKKELKKRAEQL